MQLQPLLIIIVTALFTGQMLCCRPNNNAKARLHCIADAVTQLMVSSYSYCMYLYEIGV